MVFAMSLSTLMHKYIPEILFLAGLLLIVSALYASREFGMSDWYVGLGLGLAYIMYAVGVDFFRLQHGESEQSSKTLIRNRIAEFWFLLGLLGVAFALYMYREFDMSFW